MTPAEIHGKLKEKFGDAVAFVEDAGEPWVRVKPAALVEVCRWLRDSREFAFDYLMSVGGVDYPERMESVIHLHSTTLNHRIVVKVDAPREKSEVPTVEGVWPAANWHERETYDLLGIVYTGHSDLRRILLPEDWVGFPLRKDYKFPREYRGIPLQ